MLIQSGIPRDPYDHKKRVIHFGDNNPIIKKSRTMMELILENFEDKNLRVLCYAASISIGLGIAVKGIGNGWLKGTSILLAVVIIVLVTSFSNSIK